MEQRPPVVMIGPEVGWFARSSAPSMRKCASNGRKSGYLGMLATGV
ncbi:Uncharacterised protein [Mycobacteroides abscessus subsp. abscessus]|nr:Uncharacterised protein [Mycobacteroides abscessus subsp. abscessus]